MKWGLAQNGKYTHGSAHAQTGRVRPPVYMPARHTLVSRKAVYYRRQHHKERGATRKQQYDTENTSIVVPRRKPENPHVQRLDRIMLAFACYQIHVVLTWRVFKRKTLLALFFHSRFQRMGGAPSDHTILRLVSRLLAAVSCTRDERSEASFSDV